MSDVRKHAQHVHTHARMHRNAWGCAWAPRGKTVDEMTALRVRTLITTRPDESAHKRLSYEQKVMGSKPSESIIIKCAILMPGRPYTGMTSLQHSVHGRKSST